MKLRRPTIHFVLVPVLLALLILLGSSEVSFEAEASDGPRVRQVLALDCVLFPEECSFLAVALANFGDPNWPELVRKNPDWKRSAHVLFEAAYFALLNEINYERAGNLIARGMRERLQTRLRSGLAYGEAMQLLDQHLCSRELELVLVAACKALPVLAAIALHLDTAQNPVSEGELFIEAFNGRQKPATSQKLSDRYGFELPELSDLAQHFFEENPPNVTSIQEMSCNGEAKSFLIRHKWYAGLVSPLGYSSETSCIGDISDCADWEIIDYEASGEIYLRCAHASPTNSKAVELDDPNYLLYLLFKELREMEGGRQASLHDPVPSRGLKTAGLRPSSLFLFLRRF